MCHIEDESSWTINVKLSFVLSHLPSWHLTGRPKWSFKFLWKTASKACPQCTFIHLSFFPHVPGAFLPVTWGWTAFFGSGYQAKTTWGPLCCTIPVYSSPHSRSLGGTKVLRRPHQEQACSWGSAWDPAKRCVSTAAQKSDLSSLSGVQSTKKPGLQIQTQAHHQCSVKQVKREPCSPKQGTMLGWKLKVRGLT